MSEGLLVNKENGAWTVRKALQTAHCMDYDTFCEVMHNGVGDYYSKSKFELLQRNVSRWYCDLDNGNAQKFMEYVLNSGD